MVLLNNLSTIVTAQLESPGGGGAARASSTTQVLVSLALTLNPTPNP